MFHDPSQLTIEGAESNHIAVSSSLHKVLLWVEVSYNFGGSGGVSMLYSTHQRSLDQFKLLRLLSAPREKSN